MAESLVTVVETRILQCSQISRAGFSLRLLPVNVFIFLPYFCLPQSFSWVVVLAWEEKLVVGSTYLTFSFRVSVTWGETDSFISVKKSLARDLEWPSLNQMLTLEPICWLGQVLLGNWLRCLLLDQLTVARVHFI